VVGVVVGTGAAALEDEDVGRTEVASVVGATVGAGVSVTTGESGVEVVVGVAMGAAEEIRVMVVPGAVAEGLPEPGLVEAASQTLGPGME